MTPYPGSDPLTDTGSSGAPGIIVVPFPAGYGKLSLPLSADGADVRSSGNLMAGMQANRDAIVWLAYRTPDIKSGGDYSAYQSSVTMGNFMSWTSPTVMGARGLNTVALLVNGSTHAGANAMLVLAGAGSGGAAIDAVGEGVGAGAVLTGGSNGPGGSATAGGGDNNGWTGIGHGAGFGLSGIAGATPGTPSIGAIGGPVFVNTNTPSASADPGVNKLWASSIPKAWGAAHSASGVVVTDDGENCVVTVGTVNFGLGVVHTFRVTFVQAVGGTYGIQVTFGGHVLGVTYSTTNETSAGFDIVFSQPGNTTYDSPLLTDRTIYVHVSGRQ